MAANATEDNDFARLVLLACHDLRTPLATVHGFAQTLVRTGEFEDPAARYLEMIDTASGQIADLIDELALFARIEAGRYEPVRRELDTLELVGAAAARLGEERVEAGGAGAARPRPVRLLRGRLGRRADAPRQRRRLWALGAAAAGARGRGRGVDRDHRSRRRAVDAAARRADCLPAARASGGRARDGPRRSRRRDRDVPLDPLERHPGGACGRGARRAPVVPALLVARPRLHARAAGGRGRGGLPGPDAHGRLPGRRPARARHPRGLRASRRPRLAEPAGGARPPGLPRRARRDRRRPPDLARPRVAPSDVC